MEQQKHTCPHCKGAVNYGSRFCPHCRYEFGPWPQAGAAPAAAPKADATNTVKPQRSKATIILALAAAVALLVGGYQAVKSFTGAASPAEAVIEAFAKENLSSVEEYCKAQDSGDRLPQMYLAANTFLLTTEGLTETPEYYAKFAKIFSTLDTEKYPELMAMEATKDYYARRGAAFQYLYATGEQLYGNGNPPDIYEFIGNPYTVSNSRLLSRSERLHVRNCQMLYDMLIYKDGQDYYDELQKLQQSNLAIGLFYKGKKTPRLTFGNNYTVYTDMGTLQQAFGFYEEGGLEHRPVYIFKNIGVYHNVVLPQLVESITIHNGAVNTSLGIQVRNSSKAELLQKLSSDGYFFTERSGVVDVVSPDSSVWHFMFYDNAVLHHIEIERAGNLSELQRYYEAHAGDIDELERKQLGGMTKNEFLVKVRNACRDK